MPVGNMMQQNGGAVAPVANGAAEENHHAAAARMNGRERNIARQRERQRATDEAAIRREESFQAAMAADPNMSCEELEKLLT